MNSRNIQCEVYLEGVRVNFNSVSIMESIGQAPEAVISFPVNAHIMSLYPKTICQIYFSEYIPDEEPKNQYKMVEIFRGEYYRFGFSGEFDKRNIQASFRGLLRNFDNALIVPVDVSVPSIIKDRATHIILTDKGSTNIKHELLSGESILTVLATTNKTLLPSVLIGTLIEKYAKESYFKSMYQLLKLKEQIHYFDPDSTSSLFYKMCETMSGTALLSKTHLNLSQSSPLSSIINALLSEIGFEMQEFAAANSNNERIFIKPDTTFFEPIKCNTVFNTDITSLQFSRNFDAEPTRLIRESPLLYVPNADEMGQLLVSIIVPANVLIGKAATDGKLDVLGFTAEERMRGVNVDSIDASNIAKDFMLAAANDAGILPTDVVSNMKKLFENIGKDPTKNAFDLTEALVKNIKDADKKYLVANMHTALATMAWMHKRYENRTCSISTPYSPYRLVGYTGTILTDDYPTMVGMLHSVASTITADGAATQTLTYSHCAFYDDTVGPTIDTYINQDIMQATPPWYSDFTGNNINKFYTAVTGLDGKYFRRVTSAKDGQDNKTETIQQAITDTKKELKSIGNMDSYEKYVYNHIRRALYSKDSAVVLYGNTAPRKIADEMKGDAQTMPTDGSPFILERIQRVLDIFAPAALIDAASLTAIKNGSLAGSIIMPAVTTIANL